MKHKHKPVPSGPDESDKIDSELPVEPADDMETPAEAGAGAAAALLEGFQQEVERLGQQVGEWKDRAMRTAADLDNYRRRAVKEREEWAARSASDVLNRMLEVVDDLARVAHLDPAKTPAEALHEGMLAIERKFQKALEATGVERIDPLGAPFDPTTQEAVSMMPAPSEEADGTVGAVFQAGYRLRGVLLRPAKVVVLKWTAPDVVN